MRSDAIIIADEGRFLDKTHPITWCAVGLKFYAQLQLTFSDASLRMELAVLGFIRYTYFNATHLPGDINGASHCSCLEYIYTEHLCNVSASNVGRQA